MLLLAVASAAFGRLCVETRQCTHALYGTGSAAFGRLCVETQNVNVKGDIVAVSRLRAAVC